MTIKKVKENIHAVFSKTVQWDMEFRESSVCTNAKKHSEKYWNVISVSSQVCFCVCVLPATQPLFKAALLAWDGGHQPLVPSEKWASAGSGKPQKERELGEEWARESPSGICCGRLAYGAQFGIQSDHS